MFVVLDDSLEHEAERLQLALKYEQMIVRKRGYDMHVNLWEDTTGVVHVLEWSGQYSGYGDYLLACSEERRVTIGGHVPVCRKLVTCLRCSMKY